ncbi:MAG: hypothetical protein V5B78_10670 [Desulfohalobiaceae bacterium]
MQRTMISAAVACMMLLLPVVAWAGWSVPPHPEALVDSEWLVEHAEDSNVVVLDASDRKDDTYVEKTVEGALFLPYRELRQPSGLMKGVTYGM